MELGKFFREVDLQIKICDLEVSDPVVSQQLTVVGECMWQQATKVGAADNDEAVLMNAEPLTDEIRAEIEKLIELSWTQFSR